MHMQYPEVYKLAQRLEKIFPDFQMEKGTGNSSWCFTLQHKNIPDAAMFVACRDLKKLSFSGNWPRYRSSSYTPKDTVEIGISASRDDEAIRKDVTKRLLDWYYPELAKQQEFVTNAKRQFEQRRKTIREFCELTGCHHPNDEDRDTFQVYRYGIDQAQVSYDGRSLTLRLADLPIDTVNKIVQVLKTHVKERYLDSSS